MFNLPELIARKIVAFFGEAAHRPQNRLVIGGAPSAAQRIVRLGGGTRGEVDGLVTRDRHSTTLTIG
jgi:hypothetical protein